MICNLAQPFAINYCMYVIIVYLGGKVWNSICYGYFKQSKIQETNLEIHVLLKFDTFVKKKKINMLIIYTVKLYMSVTTYKDLY